jgi:hypothetical protein
MIETPENAAAAGTTSGQLVPEATKTTPPHLAAAVVIHCDSPYFSIGTGPRGRGLFATCAIPPRTLLHVAPGLLVSRADYDSHMRHTVLEHYLFNTHTHSGDKMLALGYGSLYNHDSTRPNVDYVVDAEACTITYTTGHADIAAHTELCISYGATVWFADANDAASVASSSSTNDEEDDDAGMVGFLRRLQLGTDDQDDESHSPRTIQKVHDVAWYARLD